MVAIDSHMCCCSLKLAGIFGLGTVVFVIGHAIVVGIDGHVRVAKVTDAVQVAVQLHRIGYVEAVVLIVGDAVGIGVVDRFRTTVMRINIIIGDAAGNIAQRCQVIPILIAHRLRHPPIG